MQGKPTVHYFQLYGRAEPIRMALWKVGVEYNNNAVTGPDWMALKGSGKLPFGQVPALELADGTIIAQGSSITAYLVELYPQLKSADPLANAKADSICQHASSDVLMKVAPLIFAQGEERDANLKAAAKNIV